MQTQVLPPTKAGIQQAAELIKTHEPVAFPTETVYGLGAGVFDLTGIAKIYQLKGRPSDNPLIVHISDLDQVQMLAADIPNTFSILSQHFFPGPLTVVLKKQSQVPTMVTGGQTTVAIRMPDHQIAQDLIKAVGQPLVAPSANISGKPSPTTANHVLDDLEGHVAAVIDGQATKHGIESTVVDLTQTPPIILRPGAVTQDQLEAVLGTQVKVASNETLETARAPGMKYRHYAPTARVMLFNTPDDFFTASLSTSSTLVLSNGQDSRLSDAGYHLHPLTTASVFAEFRQADKDGYQTIAILLDDDAQQNLGLMNRLQKAALGT